MYFVGTVVLYRVRRESSSVLSFHPVVSLWWLVGENVHKIKILSVALLNNSCEWVAALLPLFGRYSLSAEINY